ncbi:hypothetical protein ACIQCQ_14450 [Streptomyces sp. NPDC088394]|uniref:hypothetical protein n=1 Tax=Streptomyces sp. NPDC088394 TaxID=3365860 RepID=UPI0037F922FC
MTRVLRPARLLAGVVMVAALSVCGADGGANGTAGQEEKGRRAPTMDMRQAGQRAVEILDGTLAAIRPPAKWAYDAPVEAACSTGLDEQTGTTAVTRSRNILTVVSGQRRDNLLGLAVGTCPEVLGEAGLSGRQCQLGQGPATDPGQEG